MTGFHSNLGSEKSNKMKKWAIFGITAVIVAGAVVWARLHGESDASQPAQAAAKGDTSQPATSSGHKWFSNIEVKATNTSTSAGTKIVTLDADGHQLDLNGLTVSHYVKSQYDAANKGDVKAAYNIYAAETICNNLPKLQRSLSDLPVNTDDGMVGFMESNIKDYQTACTDFNASPKDRLDYLRIAAQGGSAMALLTSAHEVPEGIDPSQPLDLTDPRVVQWQKDSINFLTQSAAKGNAMAMSGLSAAYEYGKSGSPNIPLALTYKLAWQMQRFPGIDIPDNDPLIGRFTSQLSPDQIATARADAAALIKSARQ